MTGTDTFIPLLPLLLTTRQGTRQVERRGQRASRLCPTWSHWSGKAVRLTTDPALGMTDLLIVAMCSPLLLLPALASALLDSGIDACWPIGAYAHMDSAMTTGASPM